MNPWKIPPFSKEVWVFLCLTFLSAVILFGYVNLVPHVDNNFFFSNNDPQFKDEIAISKAFKRKENLIIVSAQGPLRSKQYVQKIDELGNAFLKVDGVNGIKSLTHGPGSLENAFRSPLWKRLLISKDHKSTDIIILLRDSLPSTTITTIENLVAQAQSPSFHLSISGPPYIVELIGRHLLKDIRVFSVLVLIIFGIVSYVTFRSKSILLGAIVSCINASMWTLMISHLLGIKIGLLTANLATIVFVLTLSHIVFLTYNWKHVYTPGDNDLSVKKAIGLTIAPSFWSMLTASLGFFSLLLVPAQPLKELGASGIAGALVAFTVAYCIYPAFLRLATPSSAPRNILDRYQENVERFLEKKKKITIAAIFILFVVALPGLWMANTDPSLISYFNKTSAIAKGLTTVDHNGGSSPLVFVIKNASGEKLDTENSYRQMWKLQRALERNPAVGSVVSLPVVMAEAKRAPLASLLSWEWILNILRQPQFEDVADSFITVDHTQGLFLLRMNESNRKVPRLQVIDDLKQIVQDHGFVAEHVGGIYSLQGHLAKLVSSSVVFGLGQLILIFAFIAWAASRSLGIALAITLSICVIPVIVIGTIGWFHIPLDIISAPATNIALGLGIDSMLHMVKAYRREKKKGTDHGQAWQIVRHRFWQPVLTFTVVMLLGFGIFMFSEFPSTQRFGAAVVFGTIIAALTALFVMPAAARLTFKKLPQK